jgi:hypothetical protein
MGCVMGRSTGMTELDWPPVAPDDMALERKPRRCLHPKFRRVDGVCGSCGKALDPTVSRRGRTSRNRGNAFEREVAAKLGGRRVGQYGDSVDVDVPGWLRVQCKNGAGYPERLDRWLRAIPVQAGLLRAVVTGDAPGPGTRRRTLITLDLEEFVSWYGGQGWLHPYDPGYPFEEVMPEEPR